MENNMKTFKQHLKEDCKKEVESSTYQKKRFLDPEVIEEGFMIKEKMGQTYIGRFDSKAKAEKAVKDLAKKYGMSEANWLIEPDDNYVKNYSSSWPMMKMNTLVESVSKKNIKSADDLYEWLIEYMRKHSSNRFTTLQIILGNGNNITFAWDMKTNKGIHEGNKDYTMTEFVYKFMEPVIKNSGISDIWEVDMDTGRFKPTKESFIIQDTTSNNKPVYFHYGKYTGYDWGFDKNSATKFLTLQAAEKMIEKMRQEGAITDDMKVVKEAKVSGKVVELRTLKRGDEFTFAIPGYNDDKDEPSWDTVTKYDKTHDLVYWMTPAFHGTKYEHSSPATTLVIPKKYAVVKESRIAKGYENLDADEKARHLLSHPSSKYMNDLKSENITERAIRKAVKEMLGKPSKEDPEFIADVNEGCHKEAVKEEGEAPAASTTTANVANPDLPLKLKESKKIVENGSIRQYSYGSKYKMVPFESLKRGDVIFSMNPNSKAISSTPYIVKKSDGKVIEADSSDYMGWMGGSMKISKESDPMVPAITNRSDAQKAIDEYVEDIFGE